MGSKGQTLASHASGELNMTSFRATEQEGE